ncbi:heme oxygenase-like protein [Aspergillus heteromorphus CBS 117.55]|uniref:Heme oxygenase-like protein n=1 Tax=Aspergillus heteromorphus CBS 117.55 TaxID=1448321 RepID=A0A317X609_9EURO|nr:heme oxygenase-like protein [Aspergillus heteromorphus CBS 117.55]PWY92348.1 heme oxygenase-like protein [Aspergillus heteromorphus CBS 117.55]
MSPTLTTHLLTLDPPALQTSTTHPFLHAAGSGTLPRHTLSRWLSQDRLYAQAYVRFIGLLISKIRLPDVYPTSTSTSTSPSDSGGSSSNPTLEQRTLHLLSASLTNIVREMQLFDVLARKYDLDLNVPPTGERVPGPGVVTHAYGDLFASAGGTGMGLLEGLVVLWATEYCYLSSWGYARGVMDGSASDSASASASVSASHGGGGSAGDGSAGAPDYDNDLDGGALRKELIPNWTSEAFGTFVGDIAGVVDEVAAIEIGDVESDRMSGAGEALLGRCERWWRQVVWLEGGFWPDV